MVDQQEALERQRELYQEKNEHLERFLEPVAPYEFYREIFPEGSFERKGHFEDRKGNGIAVTVQKVEVDKATGIALQIEGDGKAKRCTITDELDELRELQDTDFTIMSPISYFGLRRCGKNARYLYALVFDLDGVGMPIAQLPSLLLSAYKQVVVFFFVPGSSNAFTTPLMAGLDVLAALLAAVCFFAILVRRSLWREVWRVAGAVVMLLLLPVAVSFAQIISPYSDATPTRHWRENPRAFCRSEFFPAVFSADMKSRMMQLWSCLLKQHFPM